MGCVFTKICEHGASPAALATLVAFVVEEQWPHSLSVLVDELDEEQPEGGQTRRLSRTKATLLASFEPSAAPHASTGILLRHHRSLSKPKTLAKHSEEDDGSNNDAIVYGGGIPGVALDAERVDLPEFTGVRDGGYKSRNSKLHWGIRSRAGNDPLRRRKENQDSLCVCDGLAEDTNVTLFSVFDGHGPEGAHVSHFVREQYHECLGEAYREVLQARAAAAAGNSAVNSSSKKAASVVSCDIISETFARAARNVTEKLTASGMDISVSGTTAVAMLVCDRDVFLANIGDSRAVIAQFNEIENQYILHCETRDHKPDAPDERQRIEANNGRVFEWGSFRVWLQDVDMPGLAMSRSFGDGVAKTVGVTSDPDVIIVDRVGFGRKNNPSFAVLASDGVWEFMTSDECIGFVSECIISRKMNAQETCNALVTEAYERWNAEEDVVDDITAAVVFF